MLPRRNEVGPLQVLLRHVVEEPVLVRLEAAHDRVARGGGVVALHDAICGTNASSFKTILGGAKQHGVTNWSRGLMGLYVQDSVHPITRGVSNFDLDDELFHQLHLQPGIQVLGTTFHTPKEIIPQMWVYEKGRGRVFVSMKEERAMSSPFNPTRE